MIVPLHIFQRSNCEECPYRERCQPRFLKNTRTKRSILEIRWSCKTITVYANGRIFLNTQSFRNGVEAIPSLLRRRYHVDNIPVHGKSVPDYSLDFKIAALDFQKLLDYISSWIRMLQMRKQHKTNESLLQISGNHKSKIISFTSSC